MNSYPKWVYGPNGEAVLINDEAEWPEGYRESPADWDGNDIDKTDDNGPTKAELIEEARALGVDINPRDKKEVIAAAIQAYKEAQE